MEFLILGPLEVRDGDQAVRLGAAKQRLLLGVLLLRANETVSTSSLVEELWGERPPATAEKLAQGYVHALRKQLGDGIIETRPPGYRLRADAGSLDLLEFKRLTDEARAAPLEHAVELRRRALALWRGPALADVRLAGPKRHDVGRLDELRLTTQIERIEAEIQLGLHAQLLGELEALVAQHPYHERAVALLMLALYRSGRQADALAAYRALQRRLSDELGLRPGQDLRELETAILRQEDTLAVPIAVRAPPRAEPAPTKPKRAGSRRRRRLVLGGAVALLAGSAVAVAALGVGAEPAAVTVRPNSVVAIDPATNRVVEETVLQTGILPGPVAKGAGSIWVGNLEDRSLTRIDPVANQVVKTIALRARPTAVAFGRGAVWVVDGQLGTLVRVDPDFDTVTDTISLWTPSTKYQGAGADVGEGAVWAAFGDATLARVPSTRDADAVRSTTAGPRALVVANGSVWVATAAAEVQQFSPETWNSDPLSRWSVGPDPRGIAAGDDAIWVACRDDDSVWRIPAEGFGGARQIAVGDGPTAVAFGAGAVWVANTDDGTVSRVDVETYEQVEAIEVGNSPAGVAFYRGRVWVSVQAPFTP
jgi:YVTN family beta-propeller protein